MVCECQRRITILSVENWSYHLTLRVTPQRLSASAPQRLCAFALKLERMVAVQPHVPKTCAARLTYDNRSMKSVAVLGASADRAKFGNKAVRAFLQQGWSVYPVNPKETEIEGLPCFRSIAEVPVRPRRVSVYLPPPVLCKVLPDIAAKGCDELWLNPGTESDAVLAEAERLGLNVVQACSIVGVGVSPSAF